MADQWAAKRPKGRPRSDRERMIFYVDPDIFDRVKALPRRSALINRLLRAELARMDAEPD